MSCVIVSDLEFVSVICGRIAVHLRRHVRAQVSQSINLTRNSDLFLSIGDVTVERHRYVMSLRRY